MNRFAELLDRLAYEPARNDKLRLMTEYFRSTGDPERGWALAALTGALSFQHAKPELIRSLIADRTDPVLFELSYDYVGDLSRARRADVAGLLLLSELPPPLWGRVGEGGREVTRRRRPSVTSPPDPHPFPSPQGGGEERDGQQTHTLRGYRDPHYSRQNRAAPSSLRSGSIRSRRPGAGRFIKLVTGGLRIGVSARLAKAAVAALAGKEAQEIELIWPGLAPPYAELFAWLEGRSDKPASGDPAPFRPPMLAHALDDADLAALDPADFMAEWKWDGIRVQAVAAPPPYPSPASGGG